MCSDYLDAFYEAMMNFLADIPQHHDFGEQVWKKTYRDGAHVLNQKKKNPLATEFLGVVARPEYSIHAPERSLKAQKMDGLNNS